MLANTFGNAFMNLGIASCPANRIGHTHRSGRYPGIAGSAHSFVLCPDTRFHTGGMDYRYSYRYCERSLQDACKGL